MREIAREIRAAGVKAGKLPEKQNRNCKIEYFLLEFIDEIIIRLRKLQEPLKKRIIAKTIIHD